MALGTLPPEHQSKQAGTVLHIYFDCFRFFNIPFKMKADPLRLIGKIGSIKQQRSVTAVLQVCQASLSIKKIHVDFLQSHPQYTERLLRSFWLRAWSEDQDVHTPEDMAAVARTAGMEEKEFEECLAAMNTEAVKTALKVSIK